MEQDNKLHKRRAPNPQQVLMHALQQLGYDGDDGDDDEIAGLASTFLSVNKVRQIIADTWLEPHIWNKMLVDDRRSWQ